MPSKSKKQHNLMAMCSSDEGRKKARVECPPKSLAEEFLAADKAKGSRRRGKKQ